MSASSMVQAPDAYFVFGPNGTDASTVFPVVPSEYAAVTDAAPKPQGLQMYRLGADDAQVDGVGPDAVAGHVRLIAVVAMHGLV